MVSKWAATPIEVRCGRGLAPSAPAEKPADNAVADALSKRIPRRLIFWRPNLSDAGASGRTMARSVALSGPPSAATWI